MEKDLIEQSITRTYRPSIWSRFIKSLKTYRLLSEGDHLLLILTMQKEDLLLAKLFQILKNHSDFAFEVTYYCLKDNFELLKENIKKLNIEVVVIDSYDALDKNYKRINNYTYDDVINETLLNMLYKGEYKTYIPKCIKNGITYINPLYNIRDKDIDNFFKFNELESFKKIKSKEQEFIDSLIRDLLKQNPFIEMNIFKSSTNVNTEKILGYIDNNKQKSFLEYYEKYKL